MNNKRIAITLLANIVSFVVNGLIGFFITPFIVSHVGTEAYGFVSLATSFTNYATTMMLALNSMAGRFITIEVHQNNYDEANKYFNSVLIVNLIMTAVLLLPAIICIVFAESLINISPNLVADVKALFAFVFLAFFVTLCGTAFSCSTFAANRKELEAKRQIESYIIKAVVLVGLFSVFTPYVFYMGIAMFLRNAYVFIKNVRYTKTLTPMLKISRKAYSFKKVVTLLKSGIWNTIERFSTTLFIGFDTLIANLFLGAVPMGILSVAKMMPGLMETLIYQISAMFCPEYTIAYAKKEKQRFMTGLRKSIIVSSIISNVAMCVLCVVCEDFYKLWVPSENSRLLSVLSIFTISSTFVCAGIYCIYHIVIVTNKIKTPTLVKLAVGIVSVVLSAVFAKFSDMGLYAIAGISAICNTVMHFAFYIPYAARCIDKKAMFFYKPVLVNVLVLAVTVFIGYGMKTFVAVDTWFALIGFASLVAIMAIIVNVILCTTKDEKMQAIGIIKQKFMR